MIKRLLYLNGLAVLTVILYHASAWGFIAMFFWTDRYEPVSVPNFDQLGSLSYYTLRVIEQLIIYGIPTFLFVSGYFIAISTGRSQKTIGWAVVLNRIKNLIIPFFLWSLLIIVSKVVLDNESFTPLTFARTILLGQTTDAYYFVPVLVQLYLLAPFLVPLARNRWKLLLFLTGMFQAFVMFLKYFLILDIDPGLLEPFMFLTRSWFFPAFIFWFSLGIVLGFHLPKFQPKLRSLRWGFLIGLGIVFVIGVIEWELLLRNSGQDWIGPRETIIDNVYAGLFLLMFLGFDRARLPLTELISKLGVKSYGIYLVHSPVLEYTARAIAVLVPGILAYQIIFQPILYIAALGVPLTLMWIVNRLPLRRYYQYLFG
jgi:probable poly-beta-1,6-N-acetyl-D-glucosamine export protein